MPPREEEASTACTHLGVAQQRARNAHELPLAGGEVGAALVDGAAEARRVAQCEGQQVALLEGREQRRVGVVAEGVEVGAQGAGEEGGLLRDDGEGDIGEIQGRYRGDTGEIWGSPAR